MKKLLVSLVLLASISLSAQVNGYKLSENKYQKIKQTTQKLDSLQSRALADTMASLVRTDMVFLKKKLKEKYSNCRYYYVPAVLTSDQQTELDSSGYLEEGMLIIDFYFWNVGANKDLETDGVPTYKFKQVSGKFLDMSAIWKGVFMDETTDEEILENYDARVVVSRKDWLDIRMRKDADVWKIYQN